MTKLCLPRTLFTRDFIKVRTHVFRSCEFMRQRVYLDVV